MKKCFLLYVILNFSFSISHAQGYLDFIFSYDNNGNRTYRIWDHQESKKTDPNLTDHPYIDTCSSCKLVANVYPNPTQDKLQIEILHLQPYSKICLSIYDINNKLVKYDENFYSNTELDISNLSYGMYLLKITSGNLDFKKIIIKE